jgi:hypothetical protein
VLSYAKIRFSPPYLAGTPAQLSIMQRTLRLTLLLSAILLAGCSRSMSDVAGGYFFDRWGNDDLIVAGIAYNTVMGYAQKNQLIHPIVLVFPNEQHYYPLIMHDTACGGRQKLDSGISYERSL